jgi:hypothetical protein
VKPPIADKQPWLLTINAGGAVIGVGFMVDQENALTCAHVVNRAVGLTDENQRKPDRELLVQWPRLSGAPQTRARVHPAGWLPVTSRGDGDIAILRLSDSAPPGSAPVPWATPKSFWKHSFRTFGFPEGRDIGEWAHGQLLGAVGLNWIQLEATGITGAALTAGYSGAPVWDDECDGVVGMIVAHDLDRQARIGFMVPYQAAARAMRAAKLQNDLASRASKRAKFSTTEQQREYHTTTLDVPAIVEQLCGWLSTQELKVERMEFTDGLILLASRRVKRYAKLQDKFPDAVVIRVTQRNDGVLFQYRTGKWHEHRKWAASLTSQAAWALLAVLFIPSNVVYFAGMGAIMFVLAKYYFPIQYLPERAAEVTDHLVYSGEYGSPPDQDTE